MRYLPGLGPRPDINKTSPPPQRTSAVTPGARSATRSLLTPNRGRNLPNSAATSGRTLGQGSTVATSKRISNGGPVWDICSTVFFQDRRPATHDELKEPYSRQLSAVSACT